MIWTFCNVILATLTGKNMVSKQEENVAQMVVKQLFCDDLWHCGVSNDSG
jgi:hypothetical protein